MLMEEQLIVDSVCVCGGGAICNMSSFDFSEMGDLYLPETDMIDLFLV